MMIRAIVWKEVREQGLIGLTLLILGSGILTAAAALADPPTPGAGVSDVIRFLGAGLLATLLLSVTAGTVCGGALFAAEREAGTIGFLESLPVSRWQLWRAKMAAGTALVVFEVGIVLAVAAGLGIVGTMEWVYRISGYALLAFAWGLYGSTLARTTLGSVGVAMPSAAFAAILFLIPVAAFYHNPRTNMLDGVGWLIFFGLMLIAPIVGSAWRFTRQDRDRAAEDPSTATRFESAPAAGEKPPKNISRQAHRSRLGFKALIWLSVRQLLFPGLAIAGFAAVLGLSLLQDGVQPVLVWPALALTAGVLAGVTVFVDEQSNGIARFWGERRLPLGRLWFVKIVVHAAFAVLLGIVLLLPSAIRAQATAGQLSGGRILSSIFRTMLFDTPHLGSMAWNLVVLPLAYGFAAGNLCGMLFRKAVVAAGVAGLLGGTATAFWIPSLLSGGVLWWQLWLPPALALLTGYRLMRDWASDRLAERRPLLTLAGGLAAILIAIAGGLGYRVVEIDDDPGSEDDVQYVDGLAPLEANDSGRLFRTATERFARIVQSATVTPERRTGPNDRETLEDRAMRVPYAGWNRKDLEVDEWMRKLYELDRPAGEQDETWFVQAGKAAQEKGGIFEHPLRTGTTVSALTMLNGRRMGIALLIHGLQQQANGQPAAFLDDLRTALALSRSLRNGSVIGSLSYGNEIARQAMAATERWAIALEGRPELLRDAIRAIQEDDPNEPFDPRPHFLAERYVMRDFARAPNQWLPAQITPTGRDRELVTPVVDLIGVAWSTPWERERTRRLLGVGFESGNRTPATRALIRGRPGASLFTVRSQKPEELIVADSHLRTHRRAVLLELAIRLHRAEKGTVPATLGDLVAAGYLPRVPIDPFDDNPFRYRVSTGEVLRAPPPPQAMSPVPQAIAGPNSPGVVVPTKLPNIEPRTIPPGQPILWSVGPDRTDSGGQNLPVRIGIVGGAEDIVFVVPIATPKP